MVCPTGTEKMPKVIDWLPLQMLHNGVCVLLQARNKNVLFSIKTSRKN
jgi:hypothetical protein